MFTDKQKVAMYDHCGDYMQEVTLHLVNGKPEVRFTAETAKFDDNGEETAPPYRSIKPLSEQTERDRMVRDIKWGLSTDPFDSMPTWQIAAILAAISFKTPC